MVFTGRVVTGRGEAASFTTLAWVRDWFLREQGIDPYPGTLNLRLDDDLGRRAWQALRARGGTPIEPPDARWCGAWCHAVRVNGFLPAVIVLPDVPGYPADQAEIVAAVPLRATLSLSEGEQVRIVERERLRVRAVIFDVDGTLVDSLTAFRVVADRAAARYGFAITDAMVREALNTSRDFWQVAIPSGYPDRDAVARELSREAERLWPDVLREHGRLYPDVQTTAQALREEGLGLGIVTGSRRGSIGPLRDAGLLDAFGAVVTGEDVRRRKPDPEGLVKCADALGVDPCDAVYVGDTPLDIQAARRAGMGAIGVLTGACDSAGLTACGADHIVSSLDRLARVLDPDVSDGGVPTPR
jgi:phosphoglycolate phosphatase